MIDNSNNNDDNNNNNYNSSSTNLHELFSIHRQLPLLPDNSDKSLSYICNLVKCNEIFSILHNNLSLCLIYDLNTHTHNHF